MEKFEREFDQHIKSLVEHYEPDVAPQWQHMKQQLDLENENSAFDEKINSIVAQAKVDGKELSWEHFNSRTRSQTERKNKILKARAIESMLLLLILWTLNNIGITQLIPEKVKELNAPILAESNIIADSKELLANLYPDNEEPSSAIHTNKLTLSKNSVNSIPTKLDRNILSNQVDHYSSNNSNLALYEADNIQNKVTVRYSKINTIPSSTKEIMALGINSFISTATDQNKIETIATIPSPEDSKLPYDRLHSPALNFVLSNSISNDFIQTPTIYINKKIEPLKDYSRTYIGLHTGLMVNSIESPAFVSGSSDLTQVKLGQQIGFSVNIQNRKWIIETGASYQNLNYNPNISETMGNFEEGYYKILFRKINSQIVNIPILIHRIILSGSDWQLSSKFGLSISAALKNNFTLDTFANLNGSSKPGFAIPPNSESQIAQRIKNKSNQGLLDGGSFGTNSFANAVIGIRFQKQISQRIDFISELELHKMLGQIGYGPNGDRLLTTSIKTGISINLP